MRHPARRLKLQRLFIANRGEICRRIALSARSLGIETVCLSARDELPGYLQGLITTVIRVAAETPALYLDRDGLVRLAREAGCDSVHPGFGFLSENSDFAATVTQAGLVWIGPPAAAIAAMASKDGARKIAEAHGLPCPRSYGGAIDGARLTAELKRAAEHIGYPLLVKAAGGGGGKGMRLVAGPEQLAAAWEQAHHEALHFFADGRLLLEQYLSGARHIEVQLLADQHGQVMALGDRECSLQRRKQKIIEEAPAPRLSDQTRAALHRYAIALGRAVGYQSAGTVEFLVKDADTKNRKGEGADDEIYFLEMNTRLQVEHPVTEEVFGIDLVAWQLNLAEGTALPAEFAELTPRGHSIEARFYGEDYQRDFMPAPGFVPSFIPCFYPGIRWELGLDATDTVAMNFDPMIAKVISHAPTREEALARLGLSLEQTFYAGPASNREFLGYFTRGPGAKLRWTTDLLDRELPRIIEEINIQRNRVKADAFNLAQALFARPEVSENLGSAAKDHDAVAALTRQAFLGVTAGSGNFPEGPEQATLVISSWSRKNLPTPAPEVVLLDGRFTGTSQQGDWKAAAWRSAGVTQLVVSWQGFTFHEKQGERQHHEPAGEETSGGQLCAPVPGTIIKVSTRVGARVNKDEALFLLESMKMEFEVKTTGAGIVTELHVAPGEQVQAGQLLARLSTKAESEG